MTKCDFVQIDGEVISLRHIEYMEFSQTDDLSRVRIWQSSIAERDCLEFSGSQADRFQDWWDAHANVWVIDKEERSDE